MFSISPFAIPIVAIIMVGLFPVLRAYAKKLERSQSSGVPADVAARLERMEQSLDAIAVEIERITEGQRFTTKLLSEGTRAGENKVAVRPEQSSGQG
jgi:site-specific recombinase